MAPPIKTRPNFSLSQSLPSGSFHKPLILVVRRQTDWKPQTRKPINLITWTEALSNPMKLWAMLCRATQDGQVIVESSDKMWSTGEGKGKPLKYSCLEKNTKRTPRTVWKGKKIGHWKISSPGQQVSNMLLEISGEITPERMKGQSQSINKTQLWMWLVMEVKSDAVKSNIA